MSTESYSIPVEVNSKTLFLIQLNIRSFQKIFDSLQDFLQSISHKSDWHIICISETRLTANNLISNILLPTYQLIHNVLPANADGVAMYSISVMILNLKNWPILN